MEQNADRPNDETQIFIVARLKDVKALKIEGSFMWMTMSPVMPWTPSNGATIFDLQEAIRRYWERY